MIWDKEQSGNIHRRNQRRTKKTRQEIAGQIGTQGYKFPHEDYLTTQITNIHAERKGNYCVK